MAKRYHQSKADRRSEHSGMERYERGPVRHELQGHYEGYKGRRHEEMRDAGMISEDHNAIANMPQQVMMKPWPKGGYYEPSVLDDTIRGVNEQMDADGVQMKKGFNPHK